MLYLVKLKHSIQENAGFTNILVMDKQIILITWLMLK